MPLYEFICDQCDRCFEELSPYDPTGKYEGVQCDLCGSSEKTKKPPMIVVGGPTSSKMDNFEYRAGFNMEKAKAERRFAEDHSHVGSDPYPEIDDVSSGEYFGEVK